MDNGQGYRGQNLHWFGHHRRNAFGVAQGQSFGDQFAYNEGKVGDDNERIPMEVKEGDVVLFKEWGGSKVKVEGKDYLIFTEDDVLAILK